MQINYPTHGRQFELAIAVWVKALTTKNQTLLVRQKGVSTAERVLCDMKWFECVAGHVVECSYFLLCSICCLQGQTNHICCKSLSIVVC